jgi:cellulose 1,4-beta-cellobiosidase
MGLDGNPGSYVHISKGCHWGDCTTDGVLPLQIGKIKEAKSSWSVTTISTGVWNVVLELWINTTSFAPQGADGAEIMIWLNSNNVTPYGDRYGSVSISGYTWNVTRAQFSTPFIVYRSTTDLTFVNDLDMKAFLNDAVSRGWIQEDWYLITAQAGFELWNGGAGLSSDSFSFTASGTP